METDAEVEVLQEGARKVIGRRKEKPSAADAEGEERQKRKGHGVRTVKGSRQVEKKAVKLVELGPRLSLRLTKVEEGLSSGKVMWHESVQKTKEEERVMDQVWEERRREKERRKTEQRENVERKRKERAERSGKDEDEKGKEGEELDEEEMEDWDMDDDEWFDDGLQEDDTHRHEGMNGRGQDELNGGEMERDE